MVALIVGLIACESSSSSEENECVVHADCWDSPIAQDQGRCGPQVACIEGTCDAWCPDLCEVIDPNVNPCPEPGWICAPIAIGPRCSPVEVECQTIDDCPDYRPSPEGSWTCEQGICRFPGFHYLYENP